LAFRRALIFALLVAGPAPCAAADSARVIQERVKAAFLYKFASYVEWPGDVFAHQDAPIVIGVVRAGQVSKELQQAIGGRQAAGRPLQVREVDPQAARENCCHILYIGTGGGAEWSREWLASARGLPVLTVTDSERHPRGSVINFIVVEDRVRFDISREAAERNGLQLRSALLSVARQVYSP
jgi:hypothetical protein